MKIMIWCHDPTLTISFSQLVKEIASSLIEDHEVYFLATQSPNFPDYMSIPFKVHPSSPFDPENLNGFSTAYLSFNPDVLLMVTDLGTMYYKIHADGGLEKTLEKVEEMEDMEHINLNPKIIAYAPIEGFPLNQSGREVVEYIAEKDGKIVTYDPWGIKVMKQNTIVHDDKFYDFVPIGIHEDFYDIGPLRGEILRHGSGFADKNVSICVSENRDRKGLDAVLKMAYFMKYEFHQDNFVLYMNTNASQPVINGWRLDVIAKEWNLYDEKIDDVVLFKQTSDEDRGSRFVGIPSEGSVTDMALDLKESKNPLYDEIMEGKNEELVLQFRKMMTLNDWYNLTKYSGGMLVDGSRLEGWCMPIAEAAKIGIPTVSVQDNGIRDVMWTHVFKVPCYHFHEWERFRTGAFMSTYSHRDFAHSVNIVQDRINSGDKSIERSVQEGMEISSALRWDTSVEKMKIIIEEAIDAE